MSTVADTIIDSLGGTTVVSRLTETPLSTVHSWRKNGIPRSRLAHLRLVGQDLDPPVDVEALASADADDASSGKAHDVSAEVAQ